MTSDDNTSTLLDVRRAYDFERLHHLHAANIPLEELADRMHELPPPHVPIDLFDQEYSRIERASAMLGQRGRIIGCVREVENLIQGPTATGPCTARLWRPHALLVEAIALIEASPPKTRLALDLACGSGRDAVWLALAGWKVQGWDVLPDALGKCADLAARNRVSVEVSCVNVEAEPVITPRAFDLVCCFNYLHRPLFPTLADAVRPGGYIVYETFAKPQCEMFGKPASDTHLLESGELASVFRDWNILVDREGLTGPRRYATGLIAQRPND
jgi:2-polyprenyl-3-methyl-5-hydroxy-6-metoxy-1,4-benzoquinol methylase